MVARDRGEFAQLMGAPRSRSEDMHDGEPTPHEFVRQQIAMASPRHCFGAHERRTSLEGNKSIDSGSECGSCHVVGITTKLIARQRDVARVGHRDSPTAQILEMLVRDPFRVKTLLESFAGEVWVAPGSGKASDICQAGDAFVAQK